MLRPCPRCHGQHEHSFTSAGRCPSREAVGAAPPSVPPPLPLDARLRAAWEATGDPALIEAAEGVERLEKERDAILRWSVRHAGYLGTRTVDPDDPDRWWARGDNGYVYAPTAEAAVRLAAGLGAAPAGALVPASAPADAACWVDPDNLDVE